MDSIKEAIEMLNETRQCERCGKVQHVRMFGYKMHGHRSTVCTKCFYGQSNARREQNRVTLPHFVYILIDPRDTQIKYVGESVEPKHRLGTHLSEAQHANASNRAKANWLRELMSANLKPIQVIIETTGHETAREREQYWIRTLATCGAPLLNEKHLYTEDYSI